MSKRKTLSLKKPPGKARKGGRGKQRRPEETMEAVGPKKKGKKTLRKNGEGKGEWVDIVCNTKGGEKPPKTLGGDEHERNKS